ncbi:restriction endonuclease subunit S, partial [Enterococcus faecium]|uniref:restriction endonuclease subunit S n=3 Tax=Enterococcus faecium TaxID=1352 RepID=UPI0005EB6689|nr:restriction endonuclease subunit S [Enterococcus faecium]MDT6356643.1 restriction endonuclease subunit S [Enterococcus faecium]MDT6404714.1 restriction endonuclease subunit S [Enterococcus faecium]MDT6412667.1 restriction endonuclease subunit S [Enterococcus faecium]MDT6444923.1 restriction endonuclease subunit S [Enterococcus faecium]MDT6456859.1 restriction endonuclease subunit S [Enterococcus faecium]
MSNDTRPEIRFPGFTEDWEERKLGDMMDVTSVKRIHQSDWTNSGIRFLRARDIVSAAKNEEPSDYLYISEEKYNEYSKNSGKVSQGDLLVTGVGSIGVPLLITDDNPIYFKDGNIIWFKNEHKIDGNFFYYSFINNKIQKYIRDVAGIGTVGTYTIDSGKKTPISLPTYDEQIKIGSFFKQLDHTIMLHQHELDLLKETKKGFLQKMFPKNGAKVPEIRFPGFTEDWEQRKFKEFSKKTGKKNTKDLDFPAYSVSNKAGLISQTEQFDGSRLDDLEKTNYKFVEPNEFAYNPARVNVGSIAFNNLGMTVIVSSLYVVVKMSEDLDNEFILQFIKSPTFIKEVKRNTEGSVREYLFYENFANIKFPFTRNKEEQQKIGAFFKQLDDTIALHQRKLDLLKETKKGFLQKMFV